MVKLGEVCRIVGGGTPSRKTDRYYEGTIPWVTVKDLKGYSIEDSQEHITEEAIQNSATNLIPAGTVITCTRMALGKSLINRVPVAINQDLKALICDENTYPEYLRYFLSSKADWIVSQGSGATVKGIKLDVLRDLDFPEISLPEQKRIAAILDGADEARRKRRENLALYDDLIRSLFLKTFGDPVSNPMGWEKDDLGSQLDFLTSGSRGWAKYYAETGRLFLRIQNVVNGRLQLDDVAYVNAPDTAESKRTLVQAGDVLLSITADLGRTAVVPESIGAAHINQHLAILRSISVNPTYLAQFLLTDAGKRQFGMLNKSAVKAGLNFTDIHSIKILLPPEKLQQGFADRVEEINAQKTREQELYEQHDDLFNALLQRAFKGEL